MKVTAITAGSRYVNGHGFTQPKSKQERTFGVNKKNLKIPSNENIISFMGYDVHIFDGGAHADNMKHFAESLDSDMDIMVHEVRTNSKAEHNKQMRSLYENLKKVPVKTDDEPEYIALPGLFEVSLQNLQDQYNRIMDDTIELTPENVKSNKEKLLSFLEKLEKSPYTYSSYIGYLDPNRQGIEWVSKVIREIDRLTEEGYEVYVPSGHPEHQTLNWLADSKGQKPELLHYIATGEDVDDSVKKMREHIQKKGWYDFNILNLSDANIINLKDKGGKKDYLYAGYDSTITGGERGVYNFYPVRDSKGEIRGYSYHDRSTVEYPYDEFPANEQISDISKFVGKNAADVIATKEETEEYKNFLHGKSDKKIEDFEDKLYDVEDILSEGRIKNEKIKLKGKYTDAHAELFFDKNSKDEIIFPNCDCEGSQRPSVMSMWGGCFSIFNAIAKDIDYKKQKEDTYLSYESEVSRLLSEGDDASKRNYYKSRREAEDYYNHAIELGKVHGVKDERPYIGLGDLHFENENYTNASSCYNNAINIMSKKFVEKDIPLKKVNEGVSKAYSLIFENQKYEKELKEYEAKSNIYKFLISAPEKPEGSVDDYREEIEINESILKISSLYEKVGEICEKNNEFYPAEVCRAAAKEIAAGTEKGEKVIQARAKGIEYIGDIFDEIKPY